MNVDYELSVRIKMPDDHGIRCAVALGFDMTKTIDGSNINNSTSTGSTSSTPMITDDTMTTSTDTTETTTTTETVTDTDTDIYRLIIGNQMGNMYQIGIPTTSIEPIQYRHDHTVTAILATTSTTTCTGSTTEKNNDDTLNLYITGCKDGKVRFFDSSTHTLVTTIQDNGHDKAVTSLCWVYNRTKSKKYLVTGSWDGTAKVWDISNMESSIVNKQRYYTSPTYVTTLIGHENSVCVVGIDCTKYCTSTTDDEDILLIGTGSAGMATGSQIRGQSVRIWKISISTGIATVQHHISNDHDGPIRDIISTINNNINEFNLLVTCSNDGTIKLRSIDTGITLSTLQMIGSEQQQQNNNQHPQILLSIGIPESDTIVAGAEDGSVAIFTNTNDDNNNNTTTTNKNGESFHQTQLLQHPQTVWKIITLPNGDFGTCCQDGWIRIFTRCIDRMASQKERDEYMTEMNEVIKVQGEQQSNGPTYEEIMKLPLWENNLSKIGQTEGAVQLFNKNGQAIAAQWSQDSSTWIEVGQVMGRPNDGNDNNTSNTMIDGIQYDYVFPIEVDGAGGTVISLQIGYNNGENQFVAAQRFIDTHQLPQYHLSEIADYIQQRTNTSSNRMIGNSSTTTSNATTGVPIAFYQHIPSKVYKSFDLPTKNAATTLEKMKLKIIESQLLSSISTSATIATIINPERTLDTIMGTILQNCQTSSVSYDSIELIALLLEKCHDNDDNDKNDATQLKLLFNIFPIIDLARLLILHTNSLSTCIANENRIDLWKNRIIPNIIQYCQEILSYNIPTTDDDDDIIIMKSYTAATTNIPLLSLRFFSNCLYQQAYVVSTTIPFFLNEYLHSIVSCLEVHVTSTNKSIRTAVATTLYNLCHYIHIISKTSSTGSSEGTTSTSTIVTAIVPTIISLIDTIIVLRTYELESITMILISLGTIVISNTIGKECAQSLYMITKVEPVASFYNNDILRTIAKEVYSVLG